MGLAEGIIQSQPCPAHRPRVSLHPTASQATRLPGTLPAHPGTEVASQESSGELRK